MVPIYRAAAACSIAPLWPSPMTRSPTAAPSCAGACWRTPWPPWSRTCRPAPSRRAGGARPAARRAGRRPGRDPPRFEEPGPLRNDGDGAGRHLVPDGPADPRHLRFADQRIYPAANPSAAERLGVVATGGYGRGELAPLSDIDLLFLRPYKQTPRGEQIVEFMLYLLWDLGLKVGHATHRRREPALRRARPGHPHRAARGALPVGRPRAVRRADKGFAQKFLTGDGRDFVEAKLAERDQRHQRMGDSLRRRAQRQGGQGRAARPASAVLDRQVSLSVDEPENSWPRAC